MAKKKKKTENDDLILDVESAYSNTENYINNNKKSLSFILAAVLIIVGGYLGYNQFYVKPNTAEAVNAMWKAEYYFSVDSFDLAINGDGNHYGFLDVANEYGGTESGELANYYLGVSYLHKGDFKTAIDYLIEVNTDDEIISSMALGNIGDAYLELTDYPTGISYYDKAVANSTNEFTGPIFLRKAGLAYETLGDYKNAVVYYNRIKEEYPESSEAREIMKYIARAEGLQK
jgi:tetratricopeptide (TPR) repeat protein